MGLSIEFQSFSKGDSTKEESGTAHRQLRVFTYDETLQGCRVHVVKGLSTWHAGKGASYGKLQIQANSNRMNGLTGVGLTLRPGGNHIEMWPTYDGGRLAMCDQCL